MFNRCARGWVCLTGVPEGLCQRVGMFNRCARRTVPEGGCVQCVSSRDCANISYT